MVRKSAFVLVLLIAVSIFLTSTLFAQTPTTGCCTVPGNPNICTDMEAKDCCPDPANPGFPLSPDCGGDWYDGVLCSQKTGSGELCHLDTEGCCVDYAQETCTDQSTPSYRADCPDRPNYRPGVQCDTQPECDTGCCLCSDQAISYPVTSISCVLPVNPPPGIRIECPTFCLSTQRQYSYFDENIKDEDICKKTCEGTGPVIVEGYVLNTTRDPIPGASIRGNFAPTTSGQDGNYSLALTSNDTYGITVDAGIGYGVLGTSLTIPPGTMGIIEKNFTLSTIVSGRIWGYVLDQQRQPITNPNAVVHRVKTSTLMLGSPDWALPVDGNGFYELTPTAFCSPTEECYTLYATAPGYFDSQLHLLELNVADYEKNFTLEERNDGILRAFVNDTLDDPISGVTVTIEGTNYFCTTGPGGTCYLEDGNGNTDIPQNPPGQPYTVKAEKTLYATVYDYGVVVLPRVVNPVYFTMSLGPHCTHNGEMAAYDSCFVVNNPAYCNSTGGIVENACGPPYNCGCNAANTDCSATSGRCISNLYGGCTSQCTYASTGFCEAVCEGENGCSFYDDDVKAFCDGRNGGQLYLYQGPEYVRCCTGSPFTPMPEICHDSVDNDGDNDVDCEDSDCVGEVCNTSKTPQHVCRSVGGPTAVCAEPLCGQGRVTEDDGCECAGRHANQNEYCCPLDQTIYPDYQSYRISVCGDTDCAVRGACCLGMSCFDSGSGLVGLSPSCYVSPTVPTVCCAICLEDPPFYCDFKFQCTDVSDEPNLATDQDKVGCELPCKPIKFCEDSLPIGYPGNGDVCICGGVRYTTNLSLDGVNGAEYVTGGRCCMGAGGQTYLKQIGGYCPMTGPRGTFEGTVMNHFGTLLMGALIYINESGTEVFTQGSTGPQGKFSIELAPRYSPYYYSIFARAVDHKDSDLVQVQIYDSQTTTYHFVLELLNNPCNYDKFPPGQLVVNHIPGEVLKARLEWGRGPCMNIIGYEVNRSGFPLAYVPVPATPTVVFVDDTIPLGTYNTLYTYTVSAVYAYDGQAGPHVTSNFDTGDQICEGKYYQGSFEFCHDNKRKYCEADNTLAISPHEDCSYAGRICSGPDANGQTYCRLDECGIGQQGAKPFGLYYNTLHCAQNPTEGRRYCYYDHAKRDTLSPEWYDTSYYEYFTTVDACSSCKHVKTCFDYQSQDACEANNCELGECEWKDSNFAEYGKGYCVIKDYEGFDKCLKCSSTNELYFNAFCTQEICDHLGSCYADATETSCEGCDYAVCYDFKTEQQCTGGVATQIVGSDIVPSEDVCGLGVCKWNDTNGTCYKDGNANDKPDCWVDYPTAPKECDADSEAPVTELTPPYFSVGAGSADIGFSIVLDPTSQIYWWPPRPRNPKDGGRTLHYCIDQANTCDPALAYNESYNTNNYLQLDMKTIMESLRGTIYNGKGTYYLRLYSIDLYYNRGQTQSIMFYADIDEPNIQIQTDIVLGDTPPDDPVSELQYTIQVDEDVYCNGTLETVVPLGRLPAYDIDEPQYDPLLPVQPKSTYIGAMDVRDGVYNYVVRCEDPSGNVAIETAQNIFVDALRNVEIISPVGVYSTSTVDFEVHTTDGSVCTLEGPNAASMFFTPSGGGQLIHKITSFNLLPGSQHFSTYYVECKLVGAPPDTPIDQGWFDFSVDNVPPMATFTATPDPFAVIPQVARLSGDGWQHRINRNVTLGIECDDPVLPIFGFPGFSDMVWGTNESGEYVCFVVPGQVSCNPYTQRQNVNNLPPLDFSTDLCYACEDLGGNMGPVHCGYIHMDQEPPTFEVQILDGLNLVDTVRRFVKDELPLRSRQYTIEVIASEPLSSEPELSIITEESGVVRTFPLALVDVSSPPLYKYVVDFSVPTSADYDGLELINNSKFAVYGLDTFDNPGTEITSGEFFTIDTIGPSEPLFLPTLDNPVYTSVASYVQGNDFYQAGFEGDYVEDLTIRLNYGTNRTFSFDWDSLTEQSASDPVKLQDDFVYAVESPIQILLNKSAVYNVGEYLEFDGPLLRTPDRKFYLISNVELATTPAGDKSNITLDRALHRPLNEYLGEDVSVYLYDEPEGRFEFASVPLLEGTNRFNAFAYDEVENVGDMTPMKEVVRDNDLPRLIYQYPQPGAIIGNSNLNIPVKVRVRDSNAGILTSSVNLTVDGTSYIACSGAVTCTAEPAAKELVIELAPVQYVLGGHSVSVSLTDRADNQFSDSWNFNVDDVMPSGIVVSISPGNCYNADACYARDLSPTLTLSYPHETYVDVQSVSFASGPINRVSPTQFTVPLSFTSDGLHSIEVQANITGFGNGLDYVPVVIDLTPPDFTLDTELNKDSQDNPVTGTTDVTVLGEVTEENLYEILFYGNITNNVVLTTSELPVEVVRGNNVYEADVEIVVFNATDSAEVYANVTDKAGNVADELMTVLYDSVPPEFGLVNISVPGPIYTHNDTYYDVSDPIITVYGNVSEELSSLLMNTDYTYQGGVIVNPNLQFSGVLNLGGLNSNPTTITLIATDLGGNEARTSILVGLDQKGPVATILWT